MRSAKGLRAAQSQASRSSGWLERGRDLGRAALLFGAALLAVPRASAAPAAARPATTIELDEIRVEGNTVLPTERIEETVYPFLGPNRGVADIEQARTALAALYRSAGYQTVSVVIPPQHVTQGIVYLQVVEQTVARVRVVGAKHVEPAVLKRQARSLRKGVVPNFNDVKRDLARLNTLPDRTVTPTFRPGRQANTLDVDLDVQDTLPLHGTLELDNRRSVGTTALRLNGQLNYDNLFQRGDTATFFFQVAPERLSDANVLGGSYLLRMPGTDLSFLTTYIHSNSNVVTVGDLDVVGKGDIASEEIEVPLGTESGFIHSFDASIAYKRLGEVDTIGGLSPSSNSYPVTYYPLTLAHEADWLGAKSRTTFTAAATFGLRGAGSNDLAFDNKRKYANQDFSYLRVGLTRTQELPHRFEFYLNAVGQASADPLLSTEQLAIGGLDTVRGYLEDEALGDQGAAAQLELRSPSIAPYFSKYVNSWRFHVFADNGTVSIHRALIGQASSYTLSSVGVGTRIQLFSYLNASVEDAFLLTRGPDSRADGNRVLFRLYGSF